MSASLVGSEMCIRDRTKPDQARPSRTKPDQTRRKFRPGHPRPAQVNADPVSYTHLTLPTICSV
eukprot:6605206-Alexandrium_andersonii.AAC.1